MKIGTLRHGDGRIVALETGGKWLNFTAAHEKYLEVSGQDGKAPITSVRQLVCSGQMTPVFLRKVVDSVEERDALEQFVVENATDFGLPFRPGKIVAMGRNYADHAAETGHSAPEEPIIFSKAPSTCVGPNEAIVAKSEYGRVDHEVELALVIGRQAKDVDPGDAEGFIAGYTIMNDVTSRTLQKKDIKNGHPWFRSKSIDTFGPLGPYIVLPDEFPFPPEVDLELKVNGETRQKSNTANFIFDIPQMLAFITRLMTLEPGDVISTGTPEGISQINPGDIVEATIEGIGKLSNPVVAE